MTNDSTESCITELVD